MGDSTVSVHDHYQVELRLQHSLHVPDRMFEVWLYFPSSLGIDEPRFEKDEFYAELTTYTRFQTPRLSLQALFAADDPLSPFTWLAAHQVAICAGTASVTEYQRAVRELRLLAAIYRSVVRDTAESLVSGCASGSLSGARPAVEAARFLEESRGSLERFRRMRVEMLAASLPGDLEAALRAIDDFLSLHALEAWFRVLGELQRTAPPEAGPVAAAEGVAAALQAAIDGETARRVAAGLFGAPHDDPKANEAYIARVNQLKKWVLAVLHLRLVSNRRAERAREFAFSFAAAVAMSVAVGLQLVAMWTVGMPRVPELGRTLYTFVGLAVGGYILKDGIKDRLKTWFQAGIPHWLFDLCVGTSGTVFGAVEETVTRLSPADVNPAVASLRESGEDPLFQAERAEDDVVHYRRRVRLNGRLASAQAPGMAAVNEIVRLNVHRWLRRMDDPERPLSRLGVDGRVVKVTAAKTYRVTMIMSLPPGGGTPRYERVVVVLSREGIVRIERER